MTEFYHLLALVLAMVGMQDSPRIEFIDYGVAFYNTQDDIVLYNERGYPCENDIVFCYVAIAHEVGGHRLAMKRYGVQAAISEENAYLSAINLTVADERANALAYWQYVNWWAIRNKQECDHLHDIGGSRAGC